MGARAVFCLGKKVMKLNDYPERERVEWDEKYGVGINPFKRSYSPEYTKRPTRERLVCSRTALCKGCPYPGHGFVCWGADGSCIRSRIAEINQIEKETDNHASDAMQ